MQKLTLEELTMRSIFMHYYQINISTVTHLPVQQLLYPLTMRDVRKKRTMLAAMRDTTGTKK